MRPYKEEEQDGFVIREFSQDISPIELVWHRDREDRIVEALHETDWKFQLDNEVPVFIDKLFIPKEAYHRLIKGTGNLKVKITKL